MSEPYPIPFGRYQLLEPLAVGGMAELFRAQATGAHGFERTVVIKRILPHLAADEQFTRMFINEAKITAQLSHPKIAQTYELGREGDQLFIAMEYVDGLDALALLRELAHGQQRMPPELAVYVMQEVTDALDFAHSQTGSDGEPLGIVHRDVSPSNVLMSTRGDVKLVDFGIAQAVQQEHRTKAGTLKGKYGYMSPEQVLGEEVTAKSDIFAAGVVLAEMLMGRRLFAAPNELDVLLMVRDVQLGRLDRFGTDLPPDLMAICRQCLRKRTEERFLNAAELRDALADWLYNHRKRVGAKDVADIVKRYLDQARFRQSELLKSAAATGKSTSEHVGIPLGEGPSDASSLDIEISELAALDEAAGGYEEDVEAAVLDESVALQDGGAAVAAAVQAAEPIADISIPVRAAPEAAPAVEAAPVVEAAPAMEAAPVTESASESGDGGFFELGDLDDVDLKPAWQRSAEGSGVHSTETQRAETVEATPSALALDVAVPASNIGADENESVPIVVGEPVEQPFQRARPSTRPPEPSEVVEATAPAAAEEPLSSHYDNIESAVASLSLPGPDPSAADFDDREITQGPRPSIKKQMSERPPSEAIREEPQVKASTRPKRISTVATLSGGFDETSALRVLYDRIVERATGLLIVEVGGTKKEIYFVDGRPEYVSSNVASELLGAYLVSVGAISAGELDMALAMMPHYDGKLGDTLVGLGLVRPLDIFRHLTRQVRKKLVDVCTWQQGRYHWYPDRLNSSEAFPLDLDPYEVIGAGALELTPIFLQGWIEEHKQDVPSAVTGKTELEQFQIEELQGALERLDGSSNVLVLCSRIKDPRERGRFVRCLYLLLNVGWAEF